MNLQDIKELMKEFNDSAIHKLSIEMDEVKLKLEKEPPQPLQQPVMPAVLPSVQTNSPVDSCAPTSETAPDTENGVPVTSPVVGVFYCASAPDAPAFVQVGDKVQKGQTLCIIEAMKMMNEIKAPVSGEVIRILAKQEGLVEYGETIMLIKEC